MADPIILEVQANLGDINKRLDELDNKLTTAGTDSKKLSKDLQQAFDSATSSVNRLNKTINEQERLTADFRTELGRLEAEFKRVGGAGTMAGQRIKKQMDSLKESINDNVQSVKKLKIDRTQANQSIREIKRQEKAVKDLGKTSDKTTDIVNQLGSRILAVFAVDRIVSFTTEAIKMSGELEAARVGFERVASAADLEKLREATKGTVTDLVLMQQTVQATNLGVGLQDFPKLMEFARRRAKETGQEVDSLVESIVEGLGRKSTRRLDNLGISAERLKDEMGGLSLEAATVEEVTTAFTRIATEELEKMGDEVVTTKDETDRLNTSLTNLQTTLGKIISPNLGAALGSIADTLEDVNEVVGSEGVDAWEKWAFAVIAATRFGTEYELAADRMKKKVEEFNTVLSAQKAGILGVKDALIAAGLAEEDEVEEAIVKRKGIIELLKEELALQNELVGSASTQDALNDALEKRARLQERINGLMREEFFAAPERMDAKTATEIEIERDTEAQIQYTKDYESWAAQRNQIDNSYLDLKRENNQKELEITRSLFQAVGSLMVQNAEAQKAFATFDAILGAYTAIQNALAEVKPYPLNIAAAAAIGIQAFANVASIQSQTTPSYYDGTPFLQRGNNPKGRDTIPVMAHEGEAIIPADKNSKHKGLAKAWIGGSLDSWINANYVIPKINQAIKDNKKMQSMEMASMINNSTVTNTLDPRVLSELKKSRRLQQDQLNLMSKNRRVRVRA